MHACQFAGTSAGKPFSAGPQARLEWIGKVVPTDKSLTGRAVPLAQWARFSLSVNSHSRNLLPCKQHLFGRPRDWVKGLVET